MYNYTNSSTSQVEYLLPAHGECNLFAKLHENSCDYLLIIIVPCTLVHESTHFSFGHTHCAKVWSNVPLMCVIKTVLIFSAKKLNLS